MRFKSSFASKLEDYLIYMARINRKPSYLFYSRHFDEYWFDNDYPPILTKERLDDWIKQIEDESISKQSMRISLVRQFGNYFHSMGMYDQYILPKGICAKIPKYIPYFFNESELTRFFHKCRSIKPVSGAMHQHIVLPELFSTIYCCGLRPGEAKKLLVNDVNIIDGWLDIKDTKTFRDRRLPISKILLKELCTYDALMQINMPGRIYFFPVEQDTCYGNDIGTIFLKILIKFGITATEGNPPRLYDLRHHFAFANLNRWIASGKEAGSLLPFLQRYMGHSSIDSTEYYLHLVPEFFPTFSKISLSLESNLPEVSYES